MFATLNSYESLHWYCQLHQACEPAALDAVSKLNLEAPQASVSDL